MSIEESLLSKPSELRIMLVGKVGAGKTSVMNTLLRRTEDNAFGNPPGTEQCQREEATIGGQKVVIVDTPGLCSAEKTDEEVMKATEKYLSPGPHVFLFVLSCSEKYTKEEQDMVEYFIKSIFGVKNDENVTCYTMILFTRGDKLKRKKTTIEDFIGKGSKLESFVNTCKDFYVIDNKDQSPSQVDELLEKINSKVKDNEGRYYRAETGVPTDGIRRKIALSINGCALAGAGLAGGLSQVAGSPIGAVAGIAVGAAVGGVVGCVGIVAAEHVRAFFERRRPRQEVRKSNV